MSKYTKAQRQAQANALQAIIHSARSIPNPPLLLGYAAHMELGAVYTLPLEGSLVFTVVDETPEAWVALTALGVMHVRKSNMSHNPFRKLQSLED